MHNLRVGDLVIEAKDEGDNVVVVWTGKSNDRSPHRVLAPYFEVLLARMTEAGTRGLEMHFERLAHFNSSTITYLVQLIGEARSKQIRLAFVYDANATTQRLSFEALRVFAKNDDLFELRGSSHHEQARV